MPDLVGSMELPHGRIDELKLPQHSIRAELSADSSCDVEPRAQT
jgi:hypothetical protein